MPATKTPSAPPSPKPQDRTTPPVCSRQQKNSHPNSKVRRHSQPVPTCTPPLTCTPPRNKPDPVHLQEPGTPAATHLLQAHDNPVLTRRATRSRSMATAPTFISPVTQTPPSKPEAPSLRLFDTKAAATEYANRPRSNPDAKYLVRRHEPSGKFYIVKSVYKPTGAGTYTFYEQILCTDSRWRATWKFSSVLRDTRA